MESVRFAWWNTSVSPSGRARWASSRRFGHAAGSWDTTTDVVRQLLEIEAVQLLALGEVSRDDVEALYRRAETPPLHLITDDGSGGITPRGIGVLYDPAALALVESTILVTSSMGEARLKRCLELRFQEIRSGASLWFFVVHWPSALDNAQEQKQSRLAQDLRRRIHQIPRYDHVVIMGDFNAEPFARVLCEELEATRDRTRARAKGLLYNPFWRRMGEELSLQEETAARRKGAGTYYYRSGGGPTRWHTFDQFLLSASLLGDNDWSVWEDEVTIWQEPPLLNIEKGVPHRPFDHFPIIGSLRRLAKEPKTGAGAPQ